MRIIIQILFLLCIGVAQAQVLKVTPSFPGEDDSVTIIFNASSGNGGLNNFTAPVFAHTGLITSKSTSGTDWKYVQGNWGTFDNKVLMTSLGNNLYQIKFHIRSFYGLPSGEKALKMAFVFRSQDGTKSGRESDGSDIFYSINSGGFNASISSYTGTYTFGKLGDSILISGASSSTSKLEISINGVSVKKDSGTSISYKYGINSTCVNVAVFSAFNGTVTIYDTLYIVTPDLTNIATWPAGAEDGITYLSSNKIRFSLFAPGKQFVYVIGDFNNWTPSCTYQLHRTPDANHFWLDISGFVPGKEYAFQYLVDGTIKIADPYSQVVLDPNNDNNISSSTYPNILKFPSGTTSGILTLLTPGKSSYTWQSTTYKRPAKTDLVVYEMLIRDFVSAKNFKTIKDTLGYLKRLGINCIELMPVTEFEGNNSWGYNVSFHGALDKEYGTIDDFKKLIDECHKNNIAVVMDVVFNHAFSQNSLCQLYWDPVNFRPAANNPWLNVVEKHPYNVGYDFNHESAATQYYMDKILKYWMEEFKIDGFRFDLSKGFTQKNTGSDVGAWGQYDQSRIDLLKRMGTKLFATDKDAFLILEHFADNSEEKLLSDFGFMLWGNLVHDYTEGSMGYTSNFNWGSYKDRGWAEPNVMTYLESHDEERIMFKNITSGNSNGTYNIRNLETATKRLELVGTFFFTIPGPKMFWQFAELGYDISINQNGRLGNKPINWNYQFNKNRKNLYDVWSSLIKLKTEEPIFETKDYSVNLSGFGKTIYLNSSDQNVAIAGNFNVIPLALTVNFQKIGKWYEFFTGDSIEITTTQRIVSLAPGEYRLYSTQRFNSLKKPLGSKTILTNQIKVYPNPANTFIYIELVENNRTENAAVDLIDPKGTIILSAKLSERINKIDLPQIAKGIYYLRFSTEQGVFYKTCILN